MTVSKYSWARGDLSIETIISVLAVVFFFMGAWISKQNTPQTIVDKAEFNQKKADELGLTPREIDVLNVMATGASNKEIGERLFVSESTVKTHVSNVLVKLNAKRRTQAINLARELCLLKNG